VLKVEWSHKEDTTQTIFITGQVKQAGSWTADMILQTDHTWGETITIIMQAAVVP
jgi:hypothetical protein